MREKQILRLTHQECQLSCFFPSVTFSSRFVGVGWDKPGDRVNNRGLRKSDLGTEVNEGNEEKSNSLSSGDESIRRGAIVRGSHAPETPLCPPKKSSYDRTLEDYTAGNLFFILKHLPTEPYLDSSNSFLFGNRIHVVQLNQRVARRGQFCAAAPPPLRDPPRAPRRGEQAHPPSWNQPRRRTTIVSVMTILPELSLPISRRTWKAPVCYAPCTLMYKYSDLP
jgi:hypothetical protein